MPKPLLFLLICLLLTPARAPAADPARLTEGATVSLLTIWPGNEIYLAFGHSALRVRDPELRVDLTFNYGTFDVEDPMFVPRFVKGYLNYFLAYYPYKLDLDYDRRTQNRMWYEQVLNLDGDQVNDLYRFLMDNARPEKRYYRYDFILDNCATRIRDALTEVLGQKLRFGPTGIVPTESYRRMIDRFVTDRPIVRLAFYIVLGLAADQKVTPLESQFLPAYMMRAFEASTVVRDGHEEPLVLSASVIHAPETDGVRGQRWANPAFVLWPSMVAVLAFTLRRVLGSRATGSTRPRPKRRHILDGLLLLCTGCIGCLVFYLSFFSMHAAMKGNLNLLWLLPTNVVAGVLLLTVPATHRVLSWYLVGVAVLCVVPLVAWPFWPQQMHPTMIPLMVILGARAVGLSLAIRRQTPP